MPFERLDTAHFLIVSVFTVGGLGMAFVALLSLPRRNPGAHTAEGQRARRLAGPPRATAPAPRPHITAPPPPRTESWTKPYAQPAGEWTNRRIGDAIADGVAWTATMTAATERIPPVRDDSRAWFACDTDVITRVADDTQIIPRIPVATVLPARVNGAKL